MTKRSWMGLACVGCTAISTAYAAETGDQATGVRYGARPAVSRAAVSTDGPRELERVFWDCDHAATLRLMNAGEAEECSAVTEAVLRTFDGDFAAMLAWWERNKIAEHVAREQAIGRDAP